MASTTREIFLRLSLGTPCEGEAEYHEEIARCWPGLNSLLLDPTSRIYNRVSGIVRLEVDSIYEPAQEGQHLGTVVFDVLLELNNLNPKAPADVAKPMLARELKRICARDATVRVKRVVPSETSGWHARPAGSLAYAFCGLSSGNLYEGVTGEPQQDYIGLEIAGIPGSMQSSNRNLVGLLAVLPTHMPGGYHPSSWNDSRDAMIFLPDGFAKTQFTSPFPPISTITPRLVDRKGATIKAARFHLWIRLHAVKF